MSEYLRIVRRVGWLLVIVGILDIMLMIYCIATQTSYSSSFNVFALVGGNFLLKGNLRAVRYVTLFSALLFSALLAAIIVVPWMFPIDYLMLIIRTHSFETIFYALFYLAVIWMLFWVYRQLRIPAVVEACVAAGRKGNPPKLAFVVGAAAVVVSTVLLQVVLKGETGLEAKRLATIQYGDGYKYFVSSINWRGNHVFAGLTAYNENETKEVQVDWAQ